MGSKEEYEAQKRERLRKDIRQEVEREWSEEAPAQFLDCLKRLATAAEQIAGSLETIQTMMATDGIQVAEREDHGNVVEG